MDSNLLETVNNDVISKPNSMGQTKDFGLVSVLVPAIISAISIAASAGTAAANRKFQKKQQEAQQEYNSPVAQMERLKEAGINPNLALGSISSGDFGESPAPLSDMGHVIGNAGQTVMSGLNMMFDIKTKMQQMEYMQEKINGLRAQNFFMSASYPDKLRLLAANVLSANQINDIRGFEKNFASWWNTTNPNLSQYFSSNGVDQDFYNLSPRQWSQITSMAQQQNTMEKVNQDFLNAVSSGDLLTARILGQDILNQRGQVALGYERAFNIPFQNANPLDQFLNLVLGGLMQRYGPKLMQKLYNWIDSW